MGSIPRVNTPPPVIDKTLSVEGAVADAKATGALKTIKQTIGDWICLTLDCGIKIAYFKGRYGSIAITGQEGSHFWANFSKSLPSNFFSQYPCIQCQCEVESGYNLQLVLSPSSNTSQLIGWFYTSLSVTANPYIHIFCIGV